mmetsp:Transcript_7484/g.11170  ORF Transcript_7484/g.11170 Transcript_7484/m.11170 type:complete len:196 (-) Transcript_7484:30-617(-)
MDSFAGYVPVILVAVVDDEGNWVEEEDFAETNTEEDANDDRVGEHRDQGEAAEGHGQEEEVVIHIQVVASHTQGSDVHNTKTVHHVVHDNGGVVHQRREVPSEKRSRWRVDWSRDCVLLCNHMAAVDAPHAAAADAHCDDDTPQHNDPLDDEQGGTRWHSHYEPRDCPNRPTKIPPEKVHYPLQTSPPNCDPVPS